MLRLVSLLCSGSCSCEPAVERVLYAFIVLRLRLDVLLGVETSTRKWRSRSSLSDAEGSRPPNYLLCRSTANLKFSRLAAHAGYNSELRDKSVGSTTRTEDLATRSYASSAQLLPCLRSVQSEVIDPYRQLRVGQDYTNFVSRIKFCLKRGIQSFCFLHGVP